MEEPYRILNPHRVMGLPLTSELFDEEIEEAYKAKAEKLDAADDAGLLKLQSAYKLLKERGQKLKGLRECNRKLDMLLMKKGISPKEIRCSKRPQPTGSNIWVKERYLKLSKLYSAKSPGGGSQEQSGSCNNNKSCCS